MLVTITTDASFYKGYQIGAYAFWIASDAGRVTHSDSFKGEISTSHEAEMKSILNALHMLGKQKWPITDIIINTDCMSCINLITSNKPSDWGDSLKLVFNDTIKQLKIKGTVTLKHVKGHKHKKTPRHWVNDWCDQQAKKKAKEKINLVERNK